METVQNPQKKWNPSKLIERIPRWASGAHSNECYEEPFKNIWFHIHHSDIVFPFQIKTMPTAVITELVGFITELVGFIKKNIVLGVISPSFSVSRSKHSLGQPGMFAIIFGLDRLTLEILLFMTHKCQCQLGIRSVLQARRLWVVIWVVSRRPNMESFYHSCANDQHSKNSSILFSFCH